jgi:D-alanyl-D-alanine-carboxypeptidase/D-alanyl-D-alanine-endopeptidase
MDLVERYLNAVRFWLPKAQKADVIAELAEDIRLQIEEREKELGRKLDEAEVEAFLKKRGNPMFVAGRYRPSKPLIGPTIFPIYKFVLKIVTYVYLLPGMAVWLLMALFVPSYRADYPGWALFKALWNWLWPTALYSFALITVGFAVIEKMNLPAKWEQTWSLRKLPAVRDALKIRRSSSLGEIVGTLFAAAWWIGWIRFPAVMIHTSDAVQAWTGGTLWRIFHQQFFWPAIALLLAQTVLGAANLFRPSWTRARLACRLSIDALIAVILFIFLRIHWNAFRADESWLAGRHGAGLNSAGLDALSNVVVFWMIAAAAIGNAVACLWIARRWLRFKALQRRSATLLGGLVLAVFLAGGLYGQGAMNDGKLSAAIPGDDEIVKILKERVDVQHNGTGIVVGIISPQGRRLVCYGKPGLNDARPLNGDTVFEIGSITKVFTSLLLSDMVKRGEVALNDPVAMHLPKGVRVPEWNGHKIALVDLATQTSGLPFFPTDFPLIDDDPVAGARDFAKYSAERLYRFLSSYDLLHDIGVHWEYSNLGVGLLGLALAHRVGTDYESLIHARITGPLGMKSTAIALTPELKARLAIGYDSKLQPAPETDLPAFASAGSLRSSANDLLTFLAAFLGYEPSALQPAMTTMLETRRPSDDWLAYLGGQQALGWWIIGNGDDALIAHAGDTIGFSGSIAFNPRTRSGVAVLVNGVSGGTDLAMHLLRPSYPLAKPGTPTRRQEIAVDPKLFDLYAGKYQAAPNVILVINREGAKLSFMAPGSPRVSLHAQSQRDYFIAHTDVTMTFQVNDQGRATGLILHLYGQLDVPAQRIETGPGRK